MSQNPDQFAVLKQENEELKIQNEELEKQLGIIRRATDELDKLREGATIEKIANEARNKVLGGLGILGIASIAGFFGIYTTTVNFIQEQLRKPETFDKIVKEVTNDSKEKVNVQVSENVSNKLFGEFKENEKFQSDLTNAVVVKVLKDPEFNGRINATATISAESSVKQVAQQAPNSELSIATDKALGQKNYFVVAASSTESSKLNDFTSQAASLYLKAQICQPKQGNKRSALLVTNQSSDNIRLSLDVANLVLIKAKNIDSTAYILPDNNPFFDPTKCK